MSYTSLSYQLAFLKREVIEGKAGYSPCNGTFSRIKLFCSNENR
jgi:hypothetical protein